MNLRAITGKVFADLDRAQVTPRQALLYGRLVRATLARGRQSVRIPRLEMFGRFKLSKGNVSEAINGAVLPDGRRVPGLVDLGMIQVRPATDGGLEVTVLPDATQWRCGWRFSREDDAAFVAELDAVADQVQGELLPAERGLAEAMAEVSAESAARGDARPTSSRFGNGPARAVPELGTRSMVTGTPVKPALYKAGVTGEQVTEQTVLNRLERWLGESPHEEDRNDFAHWSGFWRMKVVRPNPAKVARALDDFEARGREGWEASKSRVGALKDLLRRWE